MLCEPYGEVSVSINDIELPTLLDRDALRAFYSLENGDYPEELRIEPEEEMCGIIFSKGGVR